MKYLLLILILTLYSTKGIFACSCPPIKGLNGKHPGIVTADSLMQNTLLVQVKSKSDSGITVEILMDYHDKVDFSILFIENGQPGTHCTESTEEFQIGETYLISPHSFSVETKSTSLPICWESFVKLGTKSINAQIIDVKNGGKSNWTINQIEQELKISIPENYR